MYRSEVEEAWLKEKTSNVECLEVRDCRWAFDLLLVKAFGVACSMF